jgi:WD40 repeat protein
MFTTQQRLAAGLLLLLVVALSPTTRVVAEEKPPVKIEFKGWFSNPVFSADGKTLIYAQMSALPYGARTAPTQIVLWDVAAGKEIKKIDGPADDSLLGTIALAPDGKRLALVVWNTSLRMFDLDKGKEIGKPAGSQGATHLCFSPDGATEGWIRDGEIRLADAASSKELSKIAKDADGPALSLAFLGKNVVASYDQSKIALPGGKNPILEHQVSYWTRDPESGKKLHQIGETVTEQRTRLEGLPVQGLFVSADGKQVVLAGDRGVVQVCDAATGKKDKDSPVPWKAEAGDPIRRVVLSGNLKTAAVSSAKGVLTVWDLATGKEVHRWETGQSLDHVALSPDGKTVTATYQTPGQVGAVLLIYAN